MCRGDRVVHEESFTLEAGREVVLTAWDKDRLLSTPRDRTASVR